MASVKYIIYAVVILFLGILVGWIIKPSPDEVHDHDSQVAESTVEASSDVWTCSMHPQVRQNEPGICPICEMDLIPLENNNSIDDPAILQMSKEAVKLAQIETTIVGESDENGTSNEVGIEAEGTIELDERTIHVQSSHIAGRIESINVSFEGEYVKKGQKIASIYSTELLAATQELLTAQQLDDSFTGLTEATKQKLKNWKISEDQIQRIISSNQPLSTIDIYADHSGYILNKRISLGDYLGQGEALYTIGSTNSLWLLLNIYESELENVQVGQRIRFTTPSTGEREFTTRITYIDPLLDKTNRTATIRADINSRSGALKPGMLVNAKIQTSSSINGNNNGVSVPSSAVLWTGEKSVVYWVLSDMDVPTYQFTEVEVGRQSGNYTFITDGLSLGDEVVTNGAFAVDAAAQLNNNMSMMNRDVTIKSNVRIDAIPDYKSDTPEEFREQLNQVTTDYLDLKDALVDTDDEVAANAASMIIESLEKVDMTLMLGEAHMYWMEQMQAIKSHASKIASSKNVGAQREQFEFLTEALLHSMEAFGTVGSTYYLQYCPMAFNNKGADWISSEEKIQNPYFGDKMMKCGSVKRVIE